MLNRKDILGLKDMTKEEILEILETAKEMKLRIDDSSKRVNEIKGCSIVSLFYENSTRTSDQEISQPE